MMREYLFVISLLSAVYLSNIDLVLVMCDMFFFECGVFNYYTSDCVNNP